jgi:hypothetical protein
MGHTSYVIERPYRGETESLVEVLRRELRGKRYFARSGLVRGIEEKPHHQATSALSSHLRDRRNPRHQRLPPLDEREGQAARGDGQALTVVSHGWWKSRQGDQAARVVRVGDTQISDSLLLGKDPAPYLEGGKSFIGTECGNHLDPRRQMVRRRETRGGSMSAHPAAFREVIIACRSTSRLVRHARASDSVPRATAS